MNESATYVYCVARSPDAAAVAGAPAGLPGAGPVRVLSLGEAGGPLGADLWLVVADVPLAAYDAPEIERRLADMDWMSERAMAHEKVVEHFAAAGPVVPMKLFTLFAGDERALAGLGGRREALAGILSRIDGSAEWGLRVVFQEARARAVRSRLGQGGDGGESGTGFLLRKKRQQEAQRELVREALASAERAFQALAGQAREARRRTPVESPGVQLLLDAVFLVAGDRAEELERAVRAAAVELGELACEVTLTGPWPPYNFVEEAR